MLNAYDYDITDIAIVCAHSGIIADNGNRLYEISAMILNEDGLQQTFSSLIRYAHFTARERGHSNLSKNVILSAPTRNNVQAEFEEFLGNRKFVVIFDNRGNIADVREFCNHRRSVDLNFAAQFFLPFMETISPKRIWEFLFKKQRDKISFTTADMVQISVALIKHICGVCLNDKITRSAPAIRYYLGKSDTLFGKLFVHLARQFKNYFGEMFDPCTIRDSGKWKSFLERTTSRSREKKEKISDFKPVSYETVHALFQQMAESGKGYTFRKEQIEYARLVSNALNDAAVLTIEAGTGTGKTQGYLIPVLEFLRLNPDAKAAISTYTKSLQEQIFRQELTASKRIFNDLYRDISTVVLKGKSSYICVQKLDAMYDEEFRQEKLIGWLYFVNLVFQFRNADRDSVGDKIRFYLNSQFFRQLFNETSSRSGCTAGHLLCPAQVVTAEANSANLIITNHHKLALLDSDAALSGLFRNCIIDEANHFEHAVRNAFSEEIFSGEIADTIEYVETVLKRISGHIAGEHAGKIRRATDEIADIRSTIAEIRTVLGSIHPNAAAGMMFELERDHPVLREGMIQSLLNELKSRLQNICKHLDFMKDDEKRMVLKLVVRTSERMKNALSQIGEYADALNTIRESFALQNIVIACQLFPKNWLLIAQQVDVAQTIRHQIYEKKDCVVFTAATLCYRGSFDNFKALSGMNRLPDMQIEDEHPKEFRFAVIDSPFSKDAMQIVVPDNAVSGTFSNKDAWLKSVTELLPELIRQNKGRTLVLFSSYSDLNAVAERFAKSANAANYPLLIQQNGMSSANLCEEFRALKESVLFGVDSFWYGVDFKGDTLTQVIITRIPYPSPYDALQMARKRILSPKEFWSRYHYDTHIKLRQGIGRLIRCETDRGKVVILDKRYKLES